MNEMTISNESRLAVATNVTQSFFVLVINFMDLLLLLLISVRKLEGLKFTALVRENCLMTSRKTRKKQRTAKELQQPFFFFIFRCGCQGGPMCIVPLQQCRLPFLQQI